MHSKYDNMHKNVIFYALFYINNNVIKSIVACYQRAYMMNELIND